MLSLTSGCEPLTPDDIAEVIVFAASRRQNVVVADTLIFPNHQVCACWTLLMRSSHGVPCLIKREIGWRGYHASAVELKPVRRPSDSVLVEPAAYHVADPRVGSAVVLACTRRQRAAAKAEYIFLATFGASSVISDVPVVETV